MMKRLSLFQRGAGTALFVLVALVAPVRAEAPAAAAADVESIDSIMDAVYDVISGPAGEARDWDRFRSLFIDGARLIPRSTKAPGGVIVWSPQDYIDKAGAGLEQNGFFESEIGRKVDQYGDIAQVFSAYDSRRNADDAEPFARGIYSFQLLHHDGRWWVVTIYWQGETASNLIPEEYLRR
ncbi:MAG: hypothetical protein RIE56_13785 [Amphiplicatus sp.]